MKARVFSVADIQDRIVIRATEMNCENVKKAMQGKGDKQVDRDIFEMMMIRKFLPYWTIDQVKQKECYLSDRFKI